MCATRTGFNTCVGKYVSHDQRRNNVDFSVIDFNIALHFLRIKLRGQFCEEILCFSVFIGIFKQRW